MHSQLRLLHYAVQLQSHVTPHLRQDRLVLVLATSSMAFPCQLGGCSQLCAYDSSFQHATCTGHTLAF